MSDGPTEPAGAGGSTEPAAGDELLPDRRTDQELRDIYRRVRTVVVVGASGDPGKPAHRIPRYLQSQGYRVLPVNPRGGELLGEPVFGSVHEIEVPVDLVDVFRPPAEAETVARDAVAIGAPVLWFQPGTATGAAARLAEQAGLTVVVEECLGAAHGRLGLGPGPPDPATD